MTERLSYKIFDAITVRYNARKGKPTTIKYDTDKDGDVDLIKRYDKNGEYAGKTIFYEGNYGKWSGTYDKDYNMVGSTLEHDNILEKFNAQKQLIAKTVENEEGKKSTKTFEYNELGQKSKEVFKANSDNPKTYLYEYDKQGRITKKISTDELFKGSSVSISNSNITDYKYLDNGHKVSLSKSFWQTNYRETDEKGRVVKTYWDLANDGKIESQYEYEYIENDNGKVIESRETSTMQDKFSWVTTKKFDENGNLISERTINVDASKY